MGAIYKEWKNKRHGWTRRVKWYCDSQSVRLKFEDVNFGIANNVYNLPQDRGRAEEDWAKFKKGEPVQVWLNGKQTTI